MASNVVGVAPRAGGGTAEMSVAGKVAAALVEAGITTVFGIPGLYNVEIFDALRRRPEIRLVPVRHEQGAAFMADGYARASGREAAVLLLPGCGLLNALTGISEAYADSSPLLVLVGQVDRGFIDQNRGLLHELTGQLGVLEAVTKHAERVVEADRAEDAFSRAINAMRAGRRRPVALELPLDVQTERSYWRGLKLVAGTPGPDRTAIARAAGALAGASAPLILAGGGVVSSDAGEALAAVAERLRAPVLMTGMGVGAVPSDHPLAGGVPWIASVDVRPLVAAADAVLAVGTRLNQAMTANWDLPLPEVTIRIDVDPDEITRNLPFAHLIVADARAALLELEGALAAAGLDRRPEVTEAIAPAFAAYQEAHRLRVGSTTPWLDALRAALPRDAIVSADMSVFWGDMIGSFPLYEPRTMLFPWGMGTLGFGIPAAVGAKLARPDRPVVAIVGDGAFMFTGSELATAVQENLNIPIVVVNNESYGMIKRQQLDRFGDAAAVDLVAPSFTRLAEAYGAYAATAGSPADLAAGLENALAADRPTVIEVPWGYRFAT